MYVFNTTDLIMRVNVRTTIIIRNIVYQYKYSNSMIHNKIIYLAYIPRGNYTKKGEMFVELLFQLALNSSNQY